MTDRKRFDDDIVAPRKHIDREQIIDLDPPEKAGVAPSLRDRLADRLGDRFDGIDAVDRIGGDDDDSDPPVGGPAHPIEIDLELVELERGDRELIESPIDGDDGESSELGLDRPRPAGFTYQKIELIVGGRADAGDGFTEVEWPEETADAQGYPDVEWHGDIAGVAAEADGFAIEVDGASGGSLVDPDDFGQGM